MLLKKKNTRINLLVSLQILHDNSVIAYGGIIVRENLQSTWTQHSNLATPASQEASTVAPDLPVKALKQYGTVTPVNLSNIRSLVLTISVEKNKDKSGVLSNKVRSLRYTCFVSARLCRPYLVVWKLPSRCGGVKLWKMLYQFKVSKRSNVRKNGSYSK